MKTIYSEYKREKIGKWVLIHYEPIENDEDVVDDSDNYGLNQELEKCEGNK